MIAEPTGQVACRVCGRMLNGHTDLHTGATTYTHPASRTVAADHEPEPVPAEQVDAHHVCDFCSDDKPIYTFRTHAIDAIVLGPAGRMVEQFGTTWSACLDCATLVQSRDPDGLHARTVRHGPPLDRGEAHLVRLMQRAVLDAVLPGRGLAVLGRWQPTPLPAPILPKVRDRLAALVRGDDRLPFGLDDAVVRRRLADGLDGCRLYWIDDEFTDLARHAARNLPATTIAADQAPALHGLLAWAQPLGQRADIVAASWTSGPDGVRVVRYRSVGAGLQPKALQRLREQVGWVVPRDTRLLQAGDVVDARSPESVLVTTWLLIAQRLAETTSVPVDRAIRRAYQRGGRPAPDVRLVRIRGGSSSDSVRRVPGQAGAPHGGREREYRWWVRGHWRRQPYGPGRTQRRLIYIDPQLRGPDDKPIKASTTVRVLGNTR